MASVVAGPRSSRATSWSSWPSNRQRPRNSNRRQAGSFSFLHHAWKLKAMLWNASLASGAWGELLVDHRANITLERTYSALGFTLNSILRNCLLVSTHAPTSGSSHDLDMASRPDNFLTTPASLGFLCGNCFGWYQHSHYTFMISRGIVAEVMTQSWYWGSKLHAARISRTVSLHAIKVINGYEWNIYI